MMCSCWNHRPCRQQVGLHRLSHRVEHRLAAFRPAAGPERVTCFLELNPRGGAPPYLNLAQSSAAEARVPRKSHASV